MTLRLALPLLLAAGLAAACTSHSSAQLRVLGVQHAPADALVLQVKVVNRTAKPMRLQRLEYSFAGAGHKVGLNQREIEPGAAVVVEVPIDFDRPPNSGISGMRLLEGKLFAELDQIVQSFPVTAQVAEPGS